MSMYDSARRAELRAINMGRVGAERREVAKIVDREEMRELGARERPSMRSLLFCDTVQPYIDLCQLCGPEKNWGSGVSHHSETACAKVFADAPYRMDPRQITAQSSGVER